MFTGISNQVYRFTLSLLVFLLAIFMLDRIGGHIIKQFYFSQVAGANYRTTYAMDSTTADILVFGSSRASHHYVPKVFEDSLKMSFYNTGRDGNFIVYNYAIFKAIIGRYNPKIIIFDINPGELYFSQKDYERLSVLLPYYNNNPEIQSIIELRGPYEKYKLLSATYPYNSSLLTIAIGNLEYNKIRKADIKGYIPLHAQMTDVTFKSSEILTDNPKLDSIKLNALISIAKYCNNNNIKLLYVISPIYLRVEQNQNNEFFSKLSKNYNARFVNASNDSIFINNPEYFYDVSHLNKEGAIFFSKKIADNINN